MQNKKLSKLTLLFRGTRTSRESSIGKLKYTFASSLKTFLSVKTTKRQVTEKAYELTIIFLSVISHFQGKKYNSSHRNLRGPIYKRDNVSAELIFKAVSLRQGNTRMCIEFPTYRTSEIWTRFFKFLLGYRDIKSSDFEILSLIAKKSQVNICKFRKFPDIDVSV